MSEELDFLKNEAFHSQIKKINMAIIQKDFKLVELNVLQFYMRSSLAFNAFLHEC